MICEIKKITYVPEELDDEGMIKKESRFDVSLCLDSSEETREALLDVMAAGSKWMLINLKPEQPELPMHETTTPVEADA